uniref:Uncharacterized protein n=1 Tax=Knipowitschia caucasica TaxID=637954 RepID=A0AAV2IT71_KNICA
MQRECVLGREELVRLSQSQLTFTLAFPLASLPCLSRSWMRSRPAFWWRAWEEEEEEEEKVVVVVEEEEEALHLPGSLRRLSAYAVAPLYSSLMSLQENSGSVFHRLAISCHRELLNT